MQLQQIDPANSLERRRLAAELAADAPLMALIEGYEYIGTFEWNADGSLAFPETVKEALLWNRAWDLRLFNDRGEVHAWKQRNGWTARIYRKDQPLSPDIVDFFDRPYRLWGSLQSGGPTGWRMLAEEARGPRVYLPDEAALASADSLQVRLFVGRDERFGQARILDQAILGFTKGDSYA